jgi:tetratricopeptide (TPR) repeat protein
MKYLFFILTLVVTNINAQTILKFDKRYVESEDKWVAFPMGKDSAYAYGFIYIDASAGLTLNYEGTFRISQSGSFVPKKLDSTSMKVRLKPNNVHVAFIPDDKFNELNIDAIPQWLKYYKSDTNSIERLYRWGFLYNSWNECAKALTYLERAEKLNRKFKGLAVELSFSYNCLNQFDKAELVLEEEIKMNANDAYVNKEYIYTLARNNKIDKAAKQFETTLSKLQDNQYNAENCYTILKSYYDQKDKVNFNKWFDILQKQPIENKMITNNADRMKADINK